MGSKAIATYGLVAIVKDEAAVIERTLRSLLPYVGHWTICDTGSSDGTSEIVERVMAGVPGSLHRIEFGNFGRARSEAFALARGTARWLVATDADMEWSFDPDFDPEGPDAWMIEMGSGGLSYRLPLLLRGDLPWVSIGAVHEYTLLENGSVGSRRPTDKVRIANHGEDRSTPAKTRWHVSLLEDELQREPDNARAVYYLADAYRFLGLTSLARPLYQRRAMMGGYEEEAWYAAYRAALLAPDWPTRQEELIAAWERRPSRLEPLYDLVRELNERDQHQAAYRLATTPIVPTNDDLFVHRDVWDWGMTLQRSIAAWWTGRVEESLELCDELLAKDLPPNIRATVENNRAFCETRELVA